MGGGKGDYLQFHSYPDEVGQYVEMIKSMNGRYKTEEELQSLHVQIFLLQQKKMVIQFWQTMVGLREAERQMLRFTAAQHWRKYAFRLLN